MLLRMLTGAAFGVAVVLSASAHAEAPVKTPLFPSLTKTADDDAAEPAKGKKAADSKAKKSKETAQSKSKSEENKEAAAAKAKKEKEVAAAKAKKEKQAAAEKAKKDKQIAADKAKKEKKLAADKARKGNTELVLFGGKPKEPKPAVLKSPEQSLEPLPVMADGNSGELRSEAVNAKPGLFAGLFGGNEPRMLPETRALDATLAVKEGQRKFKLKSDFEPQVVSFPGYERGTIVIDTSSRYLYLVESSGSARRYAIAVGREGLEFKGTAKVGDKQEWPRWIPTKEMQEREPSKYAQYKDGMNGGPDNPLGARAIYLYQGKKDTRIRIHGTNQPQTIGTNASNGCFRMVNEHVMDLYNRVKMGTQVIVM